MGTFYFIQKKTGAAIGNAAPQQFNITYRYDGWQVLLIFNIKDNICQFFIQFVVQ